MAELSPGDNEPGDNDQMRKAQLVVAANAANAEDCRTLLAMLGLDGGIDASIDTENAEVSAPDSTGMCQECQRPMVPRTCSPAPEGWARQAREGLCRTCARREERANRGPRPSRASRLHQSKNPQFKAQVLALRASGRTWAEVGLALNCADRTAQRAVSQ
ncbi:hypothetical protein AB0J47_41810 [Nocardia sp. NPDC049737]|uniref:hypothetical protein n=1 Tax=Nocardia sp. NPDC049737 TaxID=3154358 RepID=UPI0034136737